jgi:hypothetical protein
MQHYPVYPVIFPYFALQSGSSSCLLLARAIVTAASLGLIDASTDFARVFHMDVVLVSTCDPFVLV